MTLHVCSIRPNLALHHWAAYHKFCCEMLFDLFFLCDLLHVQLDVSFLATNHLHLLPFPGDGYPGTAYCISGKPLGSLPGHNCIIPLGASWKLEG